MSVNPYVVGQWVRGNRFYGRESLIEELLESPKNVLWVLGTRRMGKTSLLKELELRTSAGERYFPVFWDFQGASTPPELFEVFEEALVDAEERLEELDLPLPEIQGADLFASIRKLRRRLRDHGLELLLLCDEVEELLGLSRSAPAFVARLRSTLHQGSGLRTVLASTIRLWGLTEQEGDTSPFLHGCEPPLYLSCLSDAGARSLLRQEKNERTPVALVPDEDVERIYQLSGNHPYLMQLLGKRYLEAGDLNEALAAVDRDPMVGYFFTVDFEMLDPGAQEVLVALADGGEVDRDGLATRVGTGPHELHAFVAQLAELGFLRIQGRRLELRSFFFRRWLTRRLEGREQRPAFTLTAAGRAVAAEALDRLSMGVVLVDASYRVVFSNRSGGRLLASGRALREGPEGIEALRPQGTQRLRRSGPRGVGGCFAESAGGSGVGGGLRIAADENGLHLSVMVVPLGTTSMPRGDGSVAAVFVSDPDRVVDSSDDVLRSVYGLTHAESRLAVELLAGASLDDAADRLGVTINTARTHMRRILGKTQTRRPGDFIRLVLSGPLAWVDSRPRVAGDGSESQ